MLPELPLRMSRGARAIGVFVRPARYPSNAPRGVGECHMRISDRFDLPEHEIEDVIIHEMIHYYIWYRRMPDTSAHGPAFRRIMEAINERYGRHLDISHRSSKQQLDSDNHKKLHIICLTEWTNGDRGLTLVARTRIFEIHRAFSAESRVRNIKWVYSTDPYFNRLRKSIVPKAFVLTAEMEEHLKGSIACECNGKVLRPIR